MTKEITADELGGMMDAAAEFHAKSGYPGVFDAGVFMARWSALMESGVGHVFALQVNGETVEAIGLIVYPDTLSNELCGVVGFWFVGRKTNLGPLLYGDVEAWARDSGISRLMVGILPTYSFEPMHRFLKRMGYSVKEIHMQKELTDV